AGETTWTAGSAVDVATDSTEAQTSGISLYGPDPFQSPWAFKIRVLERQKTNTILKINMSWKERVQ
ncbi:MAG: hypothetical protein VW518_11835, partial [Burkholderiaceae bacterium]